ncbi:Plectin [Rhodotorula toruloides ATCC 204091]|uniref:BY PROTMAP: gi/342320078/gb/EGU12021.1/ Plectin [Rhodotorula glutinis ATCC 204091] n=1 Tax=Rhodotorula toruloides TaxID=5286 RepID=A0A0K3CBL1_RHOTO|nr:Plectin [Rhodotorula toruloides ATCC 204091]KAK4334731.1 Plectin [Rhodotorula toruloides]PRQ76108.1 hypothetical protein AAT19DRAFT_13130 [Rhodotorula toruloides]
MHLSILLSLVTTALPLALVDAAPAPAADVASIDSYHDDGHCGGGGGGGYGGKVDNWGRCGGKGYKGPTECKDGFYCKSWNEWYSQCIEKPHSYPPPPPKTTTSTTTWALYPTYVPGGDKCDSWKKCEYGFTCVKGYCKKDHKTSTTTSYKTTTTSKTPYPTHKPQCWSDKQCSYGEVCFEGYCKKDHKTTSCSTSTTSRGGYPHSTSTTSKGGYPTGYPSTAPAWGQCGGKGWYGPTTCGAGYVCKYHNEGWSMCEPKH